MNSKVDYINLVGSDEHTVVYEVSYQKRYLYRYTVSAANTLRLQEIPYGEDLSTKAKDIQALAMKVDLVDLGR